jgi:arsenate reductase
MSIVLFICKYNQNRSQIAEGIFNNLTKKHHAISAAGNIPGLYINNESKKLISEMYKIDMSSQKPKRLTEQMLKSADRIIVMCNPNSCIFLPPDSKFDFWDIPNMETLNSEDKIKIIKEIRNKIKNLIKSLDLN